MLKLDVIFKRIFGDEKNERIIARFVSDLLELPRDSIRKIYISNVELAPEFADQKFSRLDLRMAVDDRIVNIEIQLNPEVNFKDRTLFYWSKMFGDQLKSGDTYGELNQTICINIINFNLFDWEKYHSKYMVLETEETEPLTDKLIIHFFELKKIGKYRDNKPMQYWLDLIDAETEGDLMEVQKTTTIPEIQDTIVLIRHLSADEKVRQEAYYREKRLHDEANALGSAKREGIEIGRAEGIKIGETNAINALKEMWRKQGYTEEKIKELSGEL